MSRRLFVAVLPPASVVAELAAQLVTDDERPLRWTPQEQWHVTLLFTATVDEGLVGSYAAGLADGAARLHPFELSVRGGGAFPRVEAARHVIALLDDPSGSLPVLAAGCRTAADGLGIGHDDRPYQPHLTLGRTNRPTDRSADRTWLESLQTRPWQVDEVALVESVLAGSNGARHTVVGRFPLARVS